MEIDFTFWIFLLANCAMRSADQTIDISSTLVLVTAIISLHFYSLNNSLKEIKKAIEDKQPVIIQKRVSAPEQDKK